MSILLALSGMPAEPLNVIKEYRTFNLFNTLFSVHNDNQLRANRTTSPALAGVTLNELYAERNREFAWET